jgi:hypothetical protein
MNNPVKLAQNTIRGTGLLLLVLGIALWTGNAGGLKPLHILIGLLLVLSLWALAYLASRAAVSSQLVALAVIWGLIAPILGLSQEKMLTGNAHWLIQVLHLLVGVVAIGLGEMLAGAIRRGQGAQSLHAERS